MIEAFFLTLAGRLVQERFRKPVAYALLAVAVIVGVAALAVGAWAIWSIWFVRHDAAVIEQHEAKGEQASVENRSRSVDEAINDAWTNLRLRDQREAALDKAEAVEAAKPPAERATQAPQTIAFNCTLAREDYAPAELAKMPQYQEHCR